MSRLGNSVSCASVSPMGSTRWPPERIVEALPAWMEHGGDGRVATYKTWTRGRADAPADVTIAKVFGSWREALRAAGLEPIRGAGL